MAFYAAVRIKEGDNLSWETLLQNWGRAIDRYSGQDEVSVITIEVLRNDFNKEVSMKVTRNV